MHFFYEEIRRFWWLNWDKAWKKGQGAHQIPSCSVKIVGVGTTDNGCIIISTLFLLLYGKASNFGCLPETWKNINRVKWQNMIHDLCFFPAIGILGKTGWLGALVIFTFFGVICFDSKETLILLIVNPQSSLMIQEQSQEYLCNNIYIAITLVWKFEVPQIARKT